MTPHPRLDRAGIELVKAFEGYRPRAARLAGGGWTIGYGHTASAREGAEVSEADAEALLTWDLARTAAAVEPLLFAPLERNAFNALVAFAFNVGLDAFAKSEVLKRVNEGQPLQAAQALEFWRRAELAGDSLVLDALVRRRAAEKALFLTPDAGPRPVPTPLVRPQVDTQAQALLALGPGLAAAATLLAPLEGEEAQVRADWNGPAVEVAERMSERIDRLFPPPPPTPPVDEDPLLPFEPPPPFMTGPGEPILSRAELAERFRIERAPLDSPPFGDWTLDRRRRHRDRPSVSVLLVGSAGALMFIAALMGMVWGRATLSNLAVGLAGVVCMIPAALSLLARALGERGRR